MNKQPINIVLIGAGIMSATLGVLLRKLMPEAHISIYERLDRVAAERAVGRNNHRALRRMN